MTNVDLVAPGKLLVLALTVIGCFAYIVASLFHPTDTTPAWALMTLVVGYLIGNGVGAVKGVAQAPVFQPTSPEKVAANQVVAEAEVEAARVKAIAKLVAEQLKQDLSTPAS